MPVSGAVAVYAFVHCAKGKAPRSRVRLNIVVLFNIRRADSGSFRFVNSTPAVPLSPWRTCSASLRSASDSRPDGHEGSGSRKYCLVRSAYPPKCSSDPSPKKTHERKQQGGSEEVSVPVRMTLIPCALAVSAMASLPMPLISGRGISLCHTRSSNLATMAFSSIGTG